ncbi:hypothetical protein J27TS8_12650 [Robertmurraya siralis]|uniref:Uncharacterized protein n=1 Tax=Robertmurraya siralis TaxID=77777 RepID=A0A919WGD9_9BACI|nr:hypothetical protein J27TS8_12650 [Robertmurraya siralis]
MSREHLARGHFVTLKNAKMVTETKLPRPFLLVDELNRVKKHSFPSIKHIFA